MCLTSLENRTQSKKERERKSERKEERKKESERKREEAEEEEEEESRKAKGTFTYKFLINSLFAFYDSLLGTIIQDVSG